MDKRTERTIENIRKAFIKLIIENNDVMFTIKEITAEAGINRKTFYLHYTCIEDLYKELEEQTENELIKKLEEKGFFKSKLSLKLLFESMFELINENPKLYEKLLIEDNYKFLFRNLKDKIKKNIMSQYFDNTGKLELDMKFEYVFSGLIKLFRVWAKRKEEMSEEKMYEIAYNIVKFGVQDIFDAK